MLRAPCTESNSSPFATNCRSSSMRKNGPVYRLAQSYGKSVTKNKMHKYVTASVFFNNRKRWLRMSEWFFPAALRVRAREFHQTRRRVARLSLFLPRVDVRKAQPRCRLTTTSSPMRTSRRTGKVSPVPAVCAPGSTRPAVRKADGESAHRKIADPARCFARTAAALSARRRPAKATRRAADLSSARCERS